MTDKTQPEALRLAEWCDANSAGIYRKSAEAAAELRRQHARIAELEAELEAVGAGGVQALSAAPVALAGWKLVPVEPTEEMLKAADDGDDAYTRRNFGPDVQRVMQGPYDHYCAMLAASPTPPAEQQATKETSGGFHVWRDIATAPKDGSRFVAIGYNYGLYSEGRHICVAQWFRGCWIEASDWNETSELKYLTHWLPLPSPPDNAAELNDLDVSVSPQQAAPKAAPGVGNSGFDHQTAADFLSGKTVSDESVRKFVQDSRWAHDEKASLSAMLISVRGELASREAEIALLKRALMEAEAAPQQEAIGLVESAVTGAGGFHVRLAPGAQMPAPGTKLYSAPQPAPAPLSDDAKDAARWRMAVMIGNEVMLHPEDSTQAAAVKAYMDATRSGVTLTGAVDAAIAAQGGKA